MTMGIFWQQLKVLIWRNILLKKRSGLLWLQEILFPIFLVLLLAIEKSQSPKSKGLKPRMTFPVRNLTAANFGNPIRSILVVPDTKQVRHWMQDIIAQLPSPSSVSYFKTDEDSEAVFKQNPQNVLAGLMFYKNINTNSYAIRMRHEDLPDTNILFNHDKAACRDDGEKIPGRIELMEKCVVNKYLDTGFVQLQLAVENVLLKDFGVKAEILSSRNIQVQMMSKEKYVAVENFTQVQSSLFFLISVAGLVNMLPVNIVVEKEKKNKVGMQMMGLRSSVSWLSWSIVYLIIVIIASGIMILILDWMNFFEKSCFSLFYLVLILAGSSYMALGLMLTPFVSNVRLMGYLVGILDTVTVIIYITLKISMNPWDYYSTTSPVLQYLMCLLSPLTLCVAIDQAIFLDRYKSGFCFDDSLTSGNFPLCASICMMVFDTFLYLLLMFYFDLTIPGEYGVSYPPLFFLKPFKQNSKESTEMANFVMRSSQDLDVEAVSAELRKKEGIKIASLTKVFKNKGQIITAVNEFCLEIFEGHITCLLGHNGAGKTTLINMLTGVMAPTSGLATVLGYHITNHKDMEEIHKNCGVCPQENILFDKLSCREHVKIFAAIKGVPDKDIGMLTQCVLKDVDLFHKIESFAKDLSGGEMRKLSVAIALIGNPKLLLLDEPTAGMDPNSRQLIWALLKKKKEGKVILLTTHFMDEADKLADRKAIISNGKLRCCGSSLYLKNRFGAGYNLKMTVTPDCLPKSVTYLLRSVIPKIKPLLSFGEELAYKIPITEVTNFPDLFEKIDKHGKDLGITHYGVYLTTLEEVFLRLDRKKKDTTQEEEVVNSAKQNKLDDVQQNDAILESSSSRSAGSGFDYNVDRAAAQPVDNNFLNDANEKPQSFSSVGSSNFFMVRTAAQPADNEFLKPALTGRKLWWQRIKALLRIRLLLMAHHCETVIMPFIFGIIFIILGFAFRGDRKPYPAVSLKPIYFTPYHYIKGRSEMQQKNYTKPLLVLDAVNTKNSKAFISRWEAKMFVDNYTVGLHSALDVAPHHLGIRIKKLKGQLLTSFVAIYNDSAIHSIPLIINLATQNLLNNHSVHILGSSFPWEKRKSARKNLLPGAVFALFIGAAFSFLVPNFAADAVQDREWSLRGQVRISGVDFNMYWGTFLLSDLVIFLIFAVLILILDIAFAVLGFNSSRDMVVHVALFLTNLPVYVVMGLLLSFLFAKTENCIIAVPPSLVWVAEEVYKKTELAVVLHYILCIIDPFYNLIGGLYFIERITQTILVENRTITSQEYFKMDGHILVCILMPVVHIFCVYWLMRVLDIWKVGGNTFEAFPWCTKPVTRTSISNPVLKQKEDGNVRAERERIENLELSDGKKPVVYTSNLWKEYMIRKKSDYLHEASEKTTKLAVQNLSIGVNEGEILGLLGPNGAGKSTVLKLIIAETAPTYGKVVVCGQNIRSNIVSVLQTLGYCPQHDALWEPITLRQHLKFFAAIKGIATDQIDNAVNYYISELQLQEFRNLASKKLSGGTKRKLSYIMSILGTPQLVLLDEPSTGMDPKSKRFLWNTINSTFKNTNRGAILTTQNMEEADALCGRVGILVNGKLRCLGSTQHLKSKFGSGYILEVKLAPQDGEDTEALMDALEGQLKSFFPGIQTVERIMEIAHYTIPKDNVLSLGKTFAQLEECKTSHNLIEYNFSQSTLEQVFLCFAKQQI